MKATHSDKALKTLEMLGTEGKDWLHPAVKWVEEKITVLGTKTCPDCQGERKAYYTAEQAALPLVSQDELESTAPAAHVWPKNVECEYTFKYDGHKTTIRDGFYEYSFKKELRADFAAANGLVEQDCRRCYRTARRSSMGRAYGYAFAHSTGSIVAMVEKTAMVGYIQWPEGTQHYVSRFATRDEGICNQHCDLCSKGIKRSNLVPLVTIKDNKPRAMWVGKDCARKFTGVMPLKPAKNPKKLDTVLKEAL